MRGQSEGRKIKVLFLVKLFIFLGRWKGLYIRSVYSYEQSGVERRLPLLRTFAFVTARCIPTPPRLLVAASVATQTPTIPHCALALSRRTFVNLMELNFTFQDSGLGRQNLNLVKFDRSKPPLILYISQNSL